MAYQKVNMFHQTLEAIQHVEPDEQPPQVPVTIRDLEVTDRRCSMELSMADPCPECGGFNMLVGDWVCFGSCEHCFKSKAYTKAEGLL